ncbi:uncharacterized protein LOC126655104 [Mercurialis annua]|uniref:uncharacterized protein LOC126655104 n=1 Tax=Mercurialis annua TaxID=3986 RepID=UPI00216105F9|nr:uncharacterized protein LOC126655104 [Mercurialis annua]
MSEIKVYQRKSKNNMEFGSTMLKNQEKQSELGNNWVPETPAKPTPNRALNVYAKRCRKGDSGLKLLPTPKQEDQEKGFVLVDAVDKVQEQRDWKTLSTESLCLDSDGLMDLNKSIWDLEVVGVGASHSKESLEDCTGNLVRRLDFSASGDSNKGFRVGNEQLDRVPIPEASSYAANAAPLSFEDYRTATTRSTDQSSSQDSSNAPIEGAVNKIISRFDAGNSLPGNHNHLHNIDQENNRNNPECHFARCDGQKDLQGKFAYVKENEKLHSSEGLEPATPLLKQIVGKRPRNGADVNQSPLKRTKTKKHRHRPKVAVEGRKIKSKIALEIKEKKKYVRKTKSNMKEKRKYVRSSSKTSTKEPHTESFAANLSLPSAVNQPNDEKWIEISKPNVGGAIEVSVTGYQVSDDSMLQFTISAVSKAAGRHSCDNETTALCGPNLQRNSTDPLTMARTLEDTVTRNQGSDGLMLQSTMSAVPELAVSHGCDDKLNVLRDSNLDMKSVLQPDVEKNVIGKHSPSELKLETSTESTCATRRSTRIACRNLFMRKTFDCESESSCNHTSFPEGYKGSRNKRQRKSKASILMSFLGLQIHAKKKRDRGYNRRRIEWASLVMDPIILLNETPIPFLQREIVEERPLLQQLVITQTEGMQEDLLLNHFRQSQIGEGERAVNHGVSAQNSLVPLFQHEVVEERVDVDLLSPSFDCYFFSKEHVEGNHDRDLLGRGNNLGLLLKPSSAEDDVQMIHPIELPNCKKKESRKPRKVISFPVCTTLEDGGSIKSVHDPVITKSRGGKKALSNRKHKGYSVDDLIHAFESLAPYQGSRSTKVRNSGAVVPYRGSRSTKIRDSDAIVPYKGSHSAKSKDSGAIVPYRSYKKKLKAQVLLDDETLRQYNLVMKIDDGLGEREEDKERQKKWEEGREIFLGRIKSFSSKMHIILGDRRFKPWKGSVVDSVVGVFLTQNVTDFLSSAAYMSLASRFPILSRSNQGASDDELENKYSQESSGDMVYTGTAEDSDGNRYYIAEPEPKSSVHMVDVEESGSTILQREPHNVLTCENPVNASRVMEGITPVLSSKRLNSGTFETPCSSSSASNNSHFIEDSQAENVHEEKVSLHMNFLPQDCSSQAEVRIEKTQHPQNVQLGKQLNKPEEMVCGDCALPPTTSITSMKDNSSGVASDMTRKTTRGKKNVIEEKRDWNEMGRKYARPRSSAETDSVDWEAVRQAPESEIADAIKARGQHNIMAEKIKAVLNRIIEHHGGLDLEWLRSAPYNVVEKYLLEIRGLGLKSVECLRLLTLYHRAFPVDTNVARIAVRLGWVPLEPLPGDLQLHLLEEYPIMDTIQKYLWPRLCHLDQKTLYELHYQMITFGKVFCTKLNPNCGVCPMRAECKHLASKIASQTLCLPRPSEKVEEKSEVPIICCGSSAVDENSAVVLHPTPIFTQTSESECVKQTSEPIIEEPKSPQLDDIEDFGIYHGNDEDITNQDEEIPTFNLSNEPFRANVQCFMDNYWNIHQPDGASRAIVPISVNVDSVPLRKLKNISRLRTEHQVYELPDDHQLLIGQRKRDRKDHSPYLLAIWSPGETAGSCQPPKKTCNSQGLDQLCKDEKCSFCQNILETTSETVRGTILVPCRTAMRGRFPLNGTYFQVNEVFADHATSYNPIIVPRSSIWNLLRRTVYFGTSPNAIFKACSLEEIQENFWKGFICVKGWEANTGAPRPLAKRFHCPPSKMEKITNRVGKPSKDANNGKNTRSLPQ